MRESDADILKRMLDEEGSGEVCGTLARCMHDLAKEKGEAGDGSEGEAAHWTSDAETLESLAGRFVW